jgi:hypothetical protein
MKKYYIQYNVGKAKYLVNFNDGVDTHKDGSPFYNCRIFKNKVKLAAFLTELSIGGYRETQGLQL